MAAGVVAAVVAAWAFPRAYPLFPRDWQVDKVEAEAIALERLSDLGDLPARPYVLSVLDGSMVREARLQQASDIAGPDRVRGTSLGRDLLAWEVRVYERGKPSTEWTHRARVGVNREVTELLMRVPPDAEREELEDDRARELADRFLKRAGFDLESFQDPEIRRRQLQARTDLSLRYRRSDSPMGETTSHGVTVRFAGDQIAGYELFFDDPDPAALQAAYQPVVLLQQLWIFVAVLLVPFVAVPFVRRYHRGEIGIGRGLRILALVLFCGLLLVAICGRAASAGWSFGLLTRPQVTWVVRSQLVVLYFVPMALLSFLSWSVGESLCRGKWSSKLAAFDALFQGDWLNSTFARASLRGVSGGLIAVAILWSGAFVARRWGIWASTSLLFGPWWESASWFAVPLLAAAISYGLYTGLFARLFLTSSAVRRLGTWAGGATGVLASAALFFPLIQVFPMTWAPLFWLIGPIVLVTLFLRYGIWSSVLAGVTASVVTGAGPFLAAAEPWLQFQAGLAFLAVLSPLLVSARYLWSEREFFYRYEDVPPHVRRIAERERQKVELETARRIQSSILPELPPELNGVEMAHAYLPATEVGGDFYDVLALEDGRLAVAVGDVAGHGVSSGLVMSMAKSALAVQVTFDPEVEAVFATLNRMVYQSARKRLLATLCYALVDPRERRLAYASAGHLFPYRIDSSGEVEALESISYPLGVRENLSVRVRSSQLAPGDSLFLFSDGVVEARRQGSDDLYGFERLETSLWRHGRSSVGALRQGVLDDLDEFTGPVPREDDLTLLVLRLP